VAQPLLHPVLPDPKRYVKQALAGGATEAKVIPVKNVITAEWVRLKCQFGCSGFSRRLCCPPHTPTPEQMQRVLAGYTRALIYSYAARPATYRRTNKRMYTLAFDIERAAFLDGYYKAFGLGAGPCRLCKSCNVTGLCRHPDLTRPSMESCGIDVYATARNSGLVLNVVTRTDQQSKHINLVLLD
jgi:predicted metal-binding protein